MEIIVAAWDTYQKFKKLNIVRQPYIVISFERVLRNIQKVLHF